MPFHVERVRTAIQLRDFHRVWHHVYRHDPVAVASLGFVARSVVDPRVDPFWLHAERELFVAYDGPRPIGRIAAIVDRLHNDHHGDRLGFFGFFECPPDAAVAARLVAAAAEYLERHGRDAMRGPVSPSMKGEFGVLLEGHERPPCFMMAHTPRYYARLLEGLGFRCAKRFLAFAYDIPTDAEWQDRLAGITAVSARLAARFPRVRLERATHSNLATRLREIAEAGNLVRNVGWGFVPLTAEEIRFLVARVRRVLRPEMIVTARYGDELVGYVVAAPDVNWALARCWGGQDVVRCAQLPWWLRRTRQGRVVAIGVHPGHRRKGIATRLTKSLFDLYPSIERWEFGWVAEDNVASLGVISAAVPVARSRTYAVYERSLSGA